MSLYSSALAQGETVIGQGRFIQNSNPSYFGLNHQNKVGVAYTSANINAGDKQQANYFFGILSFPKQNFSLGLDVKSAKFQNTGAVFNKAKFSFIYKVQVSQNLFFLPAVSVGYDNNSVSVSNIIFEDQINTTTGFINPETIDPLGTQITPVNYMDLGASFLVHSDTFLAGLSFGHINQPNTSFEGNLDSKLPLLITLNSAFELDINPYDRNFFHQTPICFCINIINPMEVQLMFSFSRITAKSIFNRTRREYWKSIDVCPPEYRAYCWVSCREF